MSRYQFTSESVTEGHPDKLCDQVSDAILDAILAQDPKARVACETLAKTGVVVVAGEITTTAIVEMPTIVRQTVKEIGYTSSAMGFDYESCAVLTAIEKQSPDISQGVTEGEGLFKEQGAGDQGLMFGYATDETPEFMPAPITYAHLLAKKLADVRKSNKVDFLRPDGKTQVTVEYENEVPVRCDAIVVSTQHSARRQIQDPQRSRDGPGHREGHPEEAHRQGDQILRQPHRSLRHRRPLRRLRAHRPQDHRRHLRRHGAPRRRRVQRERPVEGRPLGLLLRALRREERGGRGSRPRCEVQIAYAIGVAQPVGVHVTTYGTGKVPDETLAKYILKNFDMRPKALIEELNLLRPGYRKTAAYGHFGRSEFTWEKTSRAAKMADDLLQIERLQRRREAQGRQEARPQGVCRDGLRTPRPGKVA